MSTQLLEAPTTHMILPPSQEVANQHIKDAEAEGYITALGADALKTLSPNLAQMVVVSAKSLGAPPEIKKH